MGLLGHGVCVKLARSGLVVAGRVVVVSEPVVAIIVD